MIYDHVSASLSDHHGGDRRRKVTPRQTKRVGDLLEAGPLVVGWETTGWHAVRLRGRMGRECGVLSNGQSVWTLLPNVGEAFPKARLGSEHLEAARRHPGLPQAWPTRRRAAERRKGLSLGEDEASCAPWGSGRSTGARRGPQPEVTTSCKRKSYTVFGAMDSCSGRQFSQGSESRLTSDRDHVCWQTILAPTTPPLFLNHEGARSHTSQAPHQFGATHRERIPAYPLPSYAPADHPMAYGWKKTKKGAPQNQYCKACAALTVSVDKALAYCAAHSALV
jgi:hypothetical protein